LFLNKDIVQSANYAAITGDINAFANNFENYNYYINLLECLSYDFDEYYYLDNEDQNKVKEMILEFKNQTLKNAKYYKN
jgi:hypothetical protein